MPREVSASMFKQIVLSENYLHEKKKLYVFWYKPRFEGDDLGLSTLSLSLYFAVVLFLSLMIGTKGNVALFFTGFYRPMFMTMVVCALIPVIVSIIAGLSWLHLKKTHDIFKQKAINIDDSHIVKVLDGSCDAMVMRKFLKTV